MDKRIDYIVFLRVLCTICVLVNHVPLVASYVFTLQMRQSDFVMTQAMVHSAHFAVPVFVMITGALLLNSSRTITIEKALKKYIWRMVVILFTVGWGFAMMELLFSTKSISLNLFLDSFYCVISGNTWKHMWYLYMLVGLYLIIPFLKLVVDNSSLKSMTCLIAILFLFSSLIPTLTHFLDFQIGVDFPIKSSYVLFLLLGWLLTQICWFKSSWWLVIVGCCTTVFLVICSYLEVVRGCLQLKFWEGYDSPVEVCIGVCLFAFCVKNKDWFGSITNNFIVRLIDRNSFGIYVFHMLWVNILYKVVKFNPFEYNYVVLLFVLVFVLFLSIITTEIFRKIPYFGKYI